MIVRDIAKFIKLDVTGNTDELLTIGNVVVSSYSQDIKSSDGFRSNAIGLSGFLREIWDLDGMSSDSSQLSVTLRNKQMPLLVQHQQSLPALARSFYVGAPRWLGIDPSIVKLKPKDALKRVHANIGTGLYFHACLLTSIG